MHHRVYRSGERLGVSFLVYGIVARISCVGMDVPVGQPDNSVREI